MTSTTSGIKRRHTRYQGAIMRDGEVLLIRHREHASGRAYWLLPGGGIEPPETPEACVAREMLEETGLTVRVERLVLDQEGQGAVYDRWHTYLCTPPAGEAAPGYEPESDVAAVYGITDVLWVPLADESAWDAEIAEDRITASQLRLLRETLGSEAPGRKTPR